MRMPKRVSAGAPAPNRAGQAFENRAPRATGALMGPYRTGIQGASSLQEPCASSACMLPATGGVWRLCTSQETWGAWHWGVGTRWEAVAAPHLRRLAMREAGHGGLLGHRALQRHLRRAMQEVVCVRNLTHLAGVRCSSKPAQALGLPAAALCTMGRKLHHPPHCSNACKDMLWVTMLGINGCGRCFGQPRSFPVICHRSQCKF